MKYTLIRSKKRRRSAALVVTITGEVVVRAPLHMPQPFIDQFVSGHSSWISKRQLELRKPKVAPIRALTDTALKTLIRQLVSHYSPLMDVTPSDIRFKSVSTYWGSCSPHRILSFNLRLAYTSADAVEYVVVHELAHLRFRGHGPRFWALVEKTYPRTREMRTFLRQIPRE